MNNYYRFNVDDAYEFARVVGIKNRSKGDELEFAVCPYCHGGKNKDKNTFSISLKTGQFDCKRSSCGVRGNMINLARDFHNFNLGKDVHTYYNIDGAGDNFKRFKDSHRKIEVRDPAIAYMGKRGISEDVVRLFELTTLPDQDNVLVFPFKDETGELCNVKYRKTDFDKTKDKMKEWFITSKDGMKYKQILFGMNQCEDFTTLVITEGQIDSLSCAEAGIKNAVSVPTGKNGFTWKPNVWNWLVKFDEIVVFGDNENGEITLSKEISQFYPKRVRIVRNEDYRGCKDANEILQKYGKEALIEAVDNAEVRVSLRIKNLSNVEDVDLSKIKAYPTYIDKLDDAIGRGFHDGELIILTGKCGEGKSTFASQIVGRMIQNGLKCFCYSGELPDYMFKAWLNKQIAGTSEIASARINAINDWYRSKCYIYDNSSVIDEKEELFDVMGEAVRDLGCKFILIDNLMTAMEDKSTEDLFRQQSKFITRLTKFAKGFNVIIMLVAHPRKGNTIDNDSISGSGDITNRANVVLRYQRSNEKEHVGQNISKIHITKNRNTGKLLQDSFAILVGYDERSMRILEQKHKTSAEGKTTVYFENREFMEGVDCGDVGFEESEEVPF